MAKRPPGDADAPDGKRRRRKARPSKTVGNGPQGRDAKGRFAAGNRFSRGKRAHRVFRLRAELSVTAAEEIRPAEGRQMARKAYEMAMKGNLDAMKLLAPYTWTKMEASDVRELDDGRHATASDNVAAELLTIVGRFRRGDINREQALAEVSIMREVMRAQELDALTRALALLEGEDGHAP
jgi:hypothetical protein